MVTIIERTPRLFLIVLLLAAFLLHMAGLQRTLPILPDPDEGSFVEAAIRVASSGNLDTGFYGHPGATTVYPLALAAHVWHAITSQGSLFRADPSLLAHFVEDGWSYYFIGRILSIAYNLMTIALTVLVGRRAFNWRVGLAGGWFYALCALVILHARMVRTDTAAAFFGMLALYLMLRLVDLTRHTHLTPGSSPAQRGEADLTPGSSPARSGQALALQAAAGAAIGLAVASRYFMVALLPVLLAVDLTWIVRARRSGGPVGWWAMAAGWLAIPAAFLLALPTLLPMGTQVLRDLRTEARTTHVGADGFSFLGNLAWYATRGLPQSVEWPLALASAAGVVVIFWEGATKHRLRPLLLFLFAGVFLLGISLSPLHWHRWIIPILPVTLLAAAVALDRTVTWAARGRSARTAAWLFGAGVVLLVAWTGARAVLLDIRGANGNTRIEARAWMVENLPAGSRLLQEPYGAALVGTGLVGTGLAADEVPSLAQVGDMRLVRERGYDYAVASSDIYNRYFAEAARYPDEVAYYTALFESGDLVAEFAPAWYESGPTIRVYEP